MERTPTEKRSPKAGQLILSQGFKLGSLTIRYYGILMVAAIFLGYLVGWVRARRLGWTRAFYDDLVFWLIIFGFIGARIYYVLFYPQFYRADFAEVFKIWHGGLAIYGAVLGGALTLLWLAWRRRKNFFELSDTVVFALPLAQALGRFGNFFNYEAFGNPTNLPWKMYVPPQFRPAGYQNFSYFSPTFAYEALWDILVFAALYFFDRREMLKNPERHGILTGWYLVLYSIGRFFIEGIRLDSANILGFRGDQLTAVALAIAGLIIIFSQRKRNAPQVQ